MKLEKGTGENTAAVEEAERRAKEQRLRLAKFNAIVALSEETVDENLLLQMLNCLDQSSWMEVIEERYLGRVCGFPLCSNPVQVKVSQKYRIDLKNKKVYERSAEIDKFCCRDCFLRSSALRAQLDVEPLWIRGDEHKKIFDLKNLKIEQQREDADDIEFVQEQQLITTLGNLKIGDTVKSDDDNSVEEDEDQENDYNDDLAHHCWSFLSQKPKASCTSQKQQMTETKEVRVEDVTRMETTMNKLQSKNLSDGEKLARIRSKYSQAKLKRPPVMIEAKPLVPNHDDKVLDGYYDNFRKILSEWCGPETIRYLRCRGRLDLSESEDEVITEAEQMIAQFYAGDRPIKNEAINDALFLPPVDNVDQAKQRISLLAEMLKPSWRLLEGQLKVNGCGQQSLEIISTFRLTATNIVLDRKDYDVAVAVILRLLAYCDNSLMVFFPTSSTFSTELTSYLERIGCGTECYLELLAAVLDKLR